MLGIIILTVVVLLVLGGGMLQLRNPFSKLFGGGKSDPAPRGEVTYEGQKAKTMSERFMIEIGRGEATVAVKAKQNWDTRGGPFSGDLQPTNGTSSVRNPANPGTPAKLALDVRYCSTGFVEVETRKDPTTGRSRTVRVTVDLDRIFVCGVVLPMNQKNASAFHQDDTPDRFNSDFVGFVAGAAETTGRAAPCPTDQLARFQTAAFDAHVRSEIAKSMGVDERIVKVKRGKVGASPPKVKDRLRSDLDSYANKVDPHDSSKTFRGLDLTFLNGGGAAVDNACYLEAGAKPLDDLSHFEPNFST
jgi:hypothetical protein